ncbi:RHS repeat-associated core domain-containing protein [Streptomyces bauhiniae]
MIASGLAGRGRHRQPGCPIALVYDSGAKQRRRDYSPTGSARSGNTASVDQPFGYTGAYLDSSGLYKMGARYNDPTLGRFTQPDPSGLGFLSSASGFLDNANDWWWGWGGQPPDVSPVSQLQPTPEPSHTPRRSAVSSEQGSAAW